MKNITELKKEIEQKEKTHMTFCQFESCPSCVKYWEDKALLKQTEEIIEEIDNVYYSPRFDKKRIIEFNEFINQLKSALIGEEKKCKK